MVGRGELRDIYGAVEAKGHEWLWGGEGGWLCDTPLLLGGMLLGEMLPGAGPGYPIQPSQSPESIPGIPLTSDSFLLPTSTA